MVINKDNNKLIIGLSKSELKDLKEMGLYDFIEFVGSHYSFTGSCLELLKIDDGTYFIVDKKRNIIYESYKNISFLALKDKGIGVFNFSCSFDEFGRRNE